MRNTLSILLILYANSLFASIWTPSIFSDGMVVVSDIGNIKDIHPGNKQDVGLRLANYESYSKTNPGHTRK